MLNCVCVDLNHSEPQEFCSMEDRKARKPHHCCECGKTIQPGELYEHAAGKWGGEFNTFATCMRCVTIRRDFMQCGFIFGELWETIHEANCDKEFCLCPVSKSATQPAHAAP